MTGCKRWYKNDDTHRINGPAVMFGNIGMNDWYYNGDYIDCYSQKEFERLIRLILLW